MSTRLTRHTGPFIDLCQGQALFLLAAGWSKTIGGASALIAAKERSRFALFESRLLPTGAKLSESTAGGTSVPQRHRGENWRVALLRRRQLGNGSQPGKGLDAWVGLRILARIRERAQEALHG